MWSVLRRVAASTLGLATSTGLGPLATAAAFCSCCLLIALWLTMARECVLDLGSDDVIQFRVQNAGWVPWYHLPMRLLVGFGWT